jgi:hypothetical protein
MLFMTSKNKPWIEGKHNQQQQQPLAKSNGGQYYLQSIFHEVHEATPARWNYYWG